MCVRGRRLRRGGLLRPDVRIRRVMRIGRGMQEIVQQRFVFRKVKGTVVGLAVQYIGYSGATGDIADAGWMR